jgi:Icc-related predicted phosphoesterase
MVRTCHFSDLHGQIQQLPEADLYVCTGDILPNSRNLWLFQVKQAEMEFQNHWIKQNVSKWSKIFANPYAPLLVVRGNHSFVDESPLFAYHLGPIHEFNYPEVVQYCGLTIGGFRGVPPINGAWADELSEAELEYRCESLGKVDVLVTHGPAFGWLDNDYGSTSIRNYLEKHAPKWHLLGHIHEEFGQLDTGTTKISNAACGVNILDIE